MEKCINQSFIQPSNVSSSTSQIDSVNHIIVTFALPTVCVFGIVGNLLNLTVLTRRKHQNSFHTLEKTVNLCLIALAVSDFMFCILALLTIFLPGDGVFEEKGILSFYALHSYFFINVFIMESTLLVVAMSLERYLAVCFPLRQELYLTTRRIKYIVVFTFIFSAIFNIPVIWRFELVTLCSNNSENTIAMNASSTNHHYISRPVITISGQRDIILKGNVSAHVISPKPLTSSTSQLSKLPKNIATTLSSPNDFIKPIKDMENIQQNSSYDHPSSINSATLSTSHDLPKKLFIRYIIQESRGNETGKFAYRIAWAVVGNVIPLILLLFFNVCLCRKIYKSYKMRRQFIPNSHARRSSHILTLTSIVIVVMFFVLVAPSEFLILLSNISMNILNFMQAINFSFNFILYCIINRTFRKTLRYICTFGCHKKYDKRRMSQFITDEIEATLV